ncbi:hypothetical protein ACVXG7_19095 [Enterobacter hormaechei]
MKEVVKGVIWQRGHARIWAASWASRPAERGARCPGRDVTSRSACGPSRRGGYTLGVMLGMGVVGVGRDVPYWPCAAPSVYWRMVSGRWLWRSAKKTGAGGFGNGKCLTTCEVENKSAND